MDDSGSPSHRTAGTGAHGDADAELDVREIPKPQRHPLIFSRFDALAVGESFVLVNSHDPKHLRAEFERDHPGTYEWTYVPTGDRRLFRIRIRRLTAADLARVLASSAELLADATNGDAGPAHGAVWRLEPRQRQLDANVVRLDANGTIAAHDGPDLDVLLHVLAGSGRLVTAAGTVDIGAGQLVWLPRRSRRAIAAGPDGLAYLSVHQRRPALSVGPPA